jgi:hypothetical protein
MKLLQEDPAETTRDILYTISQQLANNSLPPFPPAKYETPQYAVVVNGLFFTSLSCSLIAALLAVLALQWVANYDMGLNTSLARKRALQRHIRWMGIEKWKMGEIIASLPLLIFVSLFLFFIGIADWLWHLNRAISSIVIGGIGVGCLVYSITNLISIVKLEAPFRTSISKGLAPLARRMIIWMNILVFMSHLGALKSIKGWRKIRWGLIRDIWDAIYNHTTVPPQSFAKCEEVAIEGKDETALDSLIWLANSIEITPASRDIFLTLTKEIIQLPGELLLNNKKINRAPWESIFTELCAPYFGKKSLDGFSEEEVKNARDICQAFSMISNGITSPALSTFFGSIKARDPSTDLAIQLSRYRQLKWSPMSLSSALEKVFNPGLPVKGSSLHFLLLTIQQAWPSLGDWRDHILYNLMMTCIHHEDSYPIPIKSLRIIIDLVGRGDEEQSESVNAVEESTVIVRYISAVQRMKRGLDWRLIDVIHRAIQNQLLSRISRVDFSLPSAIEDFAVALKLLLQLVGGKHLALVEEERDKFVHILVKIYTRNQDAIIKGMAEEALLNGLKYSFETDDQPLSRWTALVLAIDQYLTSGRIRSKEDYRNTVHVITRQTPARNLYTPEISLQNTLIRIKDPNIALWLTHYCPDDWQFEALLHPNFKKWSDWVANEVFRLLPSRLPLISSKSYIGFFHSMIVDGTPTSQLFALSSLNYCYQFHRFNFNPEQVIGLICAMSNPSLTYSLGFGAGAICISSEQDL